MKAKAKKMNDIAISKGKLVARSTAGRIRKAADSWAAKFGREWNKKSISKRSTKWPSGADPTTQEEKFYDDCAKTDKPLENNMEADHVLEVQLGGRVAGPFLWLDAEVNQSSGRQIRSARSRGVTEPTGFVSRNCD